MNYFRLWFLTTITGIINPNNLVYYTLSEAYVVEGKADRFKPTTYNVTINGHDVNMAVRSANAFVIDANLFKCSYLLGEPFLNQSRHMIKN